MVLRWPLTPSPCDGPVCRSDGQCSAQVLEVRRWRGGVTGGGWLLLQYTGKPWKILEYRVQIGCAYKYMRSDELWAGIMPRLPRASLLYTTLQPNTAPQQLNRVQAVIRLVPIVPCGRFTDHYAP